MGYGCYVHVPFCSGNKCPYCGFYSIPYSSALAKSFISAVHTHTRGIKSPAIDTLYFGGGTPTALSPDELGMLIDGIAEILPFNEDAEITIEVNPDSVLIETASLLAKLGVNRISLGIQSLLDEQLETLGRRHNSDQALRAYEIFRRHPFSISFDLIYGIPGQSLNDWETTLKRVVELSPDHISTYCLSYEDGTPFADAVRVGKLTPHDSELEREMFEMVTSYLTASGFRHYEISNFAKPDSESRHNLKYWTGKGYLAFGPAAHGYCPGPPKWTRFAAGKDLKNYIRRIQSGEEPWEMVEELDLAKRSAEFLLLRLRLIEGFSEDNVARQFPELDAEQYVKCLAPLISDGKLLKDDGSIRIVPSELFISDSIVYRAIQLTEPYVSRMTT